MAPKCCLDINRIPKELRLIMNLISFNDEEVFQKDINQWKNEEFDWRLFKELALHHRVYPILKYKLKMIDKSVTPPDIIRSFNQLYVTNTFNMFHLSGEMEKISRLFNKEKIRLLSLKGPVLGVDLYGDISLRTSGDLDFLISFKDLASVENLLTCQGYKKDEYIQSVLNDWTWRHHHVTYFHTDKNIKVEIHWRLNPGPGKEPSFDDLWSRKRRSTISSTPIYYLGKEDLFLFLVSHGARHGWSRLRWLLDIHQLAKQNLDWETLYSLLKHYHYKQIGGQALVLSSTLLNTPITKGMGKLMNGEQPAKLAQDALFYLERMINLHSEPLPTDVAYYHKHHLTTLMTKKQKLLFFLSYLYPYPVDALTLPLPKCLHFLYFLLRPFLWAWRKTKQHPI